MELMGSEVTQIATGRGVIDRYLWSVGSWYKNNEILPRKIMELMGSKVTQLATGRRVIDRYIWSVGSWYKT